MYGNKPFDVPLDIVPYISEVGRSVYRRTAPTGGYGVDIDRNWRLLQTRVFAIFGGGEDLCPQVLKCVV